MISKYECMYDFVGSFSGEISVDARRRIVWLRCSVRGTSSVQDEDWFSTVILDGSNPAEASMRIEISQFIPTTRHKSLFSDAVSSVSVSVDAEFFCDIKQSQSTINFDFGEIQKCRIDGSFENIWRATKYSNDINVLFSKTLFTLKGSISVTRYKVTPFVSKPTSSNCEKQLKNQSGFVKDTQNIYEDKPASSVSSSMNDLLISKSSSSIGTGQQDILLDLAKDMKRMYKDSSAWDVKFILSDTELKAHKCILISRSPVFASMFEHDMKEKNTNEIPIEDFDLLTFDSFLLFLYTGEIEDRNWDTVLGMYSAASKYQVQSLQKVCSEIIRSGMTSENVCSVLVLSDMHSDEELKGSAKAFLQRCFKSVSSTKEWIDVIKHHPILATEVFSFFSNQFSIAKSHPASSNK